MSYNTTVLFACAQRLTGSQLRLPQRPGNVHFVALLDHEALSLIKASGVARAVNGSYSYISVCHLHDFHERKEQHHVPFPATIQTVTVNIRRIKATTDVARSRID